MRDHMGQLTPLLKPFTYLCFGYMVEERTVFLRSCCFFLALSARQLCRFVLRKWERCRTSLTIVQTTFFQFPSCSFIAACAAADLWPNRPRAKAHGRMTGHMSVTTSASATVRRRTAQLICNARLRACCAHASTYKTHARCPCATGYCSSTRLLQANCSSVRGLCGIQSSTIDPAWASYSRISTAPRLLLELRYILHQQSGSNQAA